MIKNDFELNIFEDLFFRWVIIFNEVLYKVVKDKGVLNFGNE